MLWRDDAVDCFKFCLEMLWRDDAVGSSGEGSDNAILRGRGTQEL